MPDRNPAGRAASTGIASSLTSDLAACRDLTSDRRRLACYDRLSLGDPAGTGQRFSGIGTGQIGPLTLAASTWLDYESDDVVMVIYVMDAEGQVVQNLHRAGVGSSRYLIEAPGRYLMQINATGAWRISLRPSS